MESHSRPLSPLEEICIDNIKKSLFAFFELRGFVMTSGRKDEEVMKPRVIHIMDEKIQDFRCLETFEEISEAGPAYFREFYDFSTDCLLTMI